MANIHIQNVAKMRIPPHRILKAAANIVLCDFVKQAELSILVTGDEESAQLNEQYRHKKGSTNVLAFPMAEKRSVSHHLIGDLILCAPVIKREAKEQHKSFSMHFSHMIIHGTLHLMGFDHQVEKEAEKMERLEIKYMKKLGFENPYERTDL